MHLLWTSEHSTRFAVEPPCLQWLKLNMLASPQILTPEDLTCVFHQTLCIFPLTVPCSCEQYVHPLLFLCTYFDHGQELIGNLEDWTVSPEMSALSCRCVNNHFRCIVSICGKTLRVPKFLPLFKMNTGHRHCRSWPNACLSYMYATVNRKTHWYWWYLFKVETS